MPAETRGTPLVSRIARLAARSSAILMPMQQPLRARVRKGRILLDEPTDLPEGEVELVPLDVVLANGGDYLDDEERKRLHESLRRSIAQARAGQLVDADEVIAKLLARG
jgi:hypothetical protein